MKIKKNILLASFDVCCFCAVAVLSYILSYFSSSSGISVHGEEALRLYAINSGILLVLTFAFRVVLGVYSTVWRYTSTQAYFRLVLSDIFGGVTAFLCSLLFRITIGVWFFIIISALGALAALSARYCYRLIYKYRCRKNAPEESAPKIRVAIVGAGQLGVYLANELSSNPSSYYEPACFIDTDKQKVGNTAAGLKIFHPDSVKEVIRNYSINEIIVAVVGLSSEEISAFYRFYEKFGCKVKIYDSPIHQALTDDSSKRRIVREFQIEDLLFRKPLSINDQNALNYFRDKVILVTGGGGSIGSELCRQIAKCHPKQLVIFEIYENNAYDIQQELTAQYGASLDLKVEIGSVRDRERLDNLFRTYTPDIVFHAAAHKHVPLMENSAGEAIKNNILGTYNTADMAEKYGVQKFILISTDKAVNPTNIMGASKRFCEMVVQCRTDSRTSFAAVRFGNVLGSNGSVIPLFKRQIANGGPVTITDKRIVRYFMTIPEASQLVMQAGAMAKNGELFVLDMGKPVRIYELAENMIKLSGFVPNVDIKIEEIGLRPGEKLYEELLIKSEHLTMTDNSMIFIEQDTPLSREAVEANIDLLRRAVDIWQTDGDPEIVKKAIRQVVPTFRDPEEINCDAERSDEMKMAVAN